MNRTEVLDRVGGLLLLPNTELATTKMVADFYGVELNTLKQLIKRNTSELENNGMKMTTYREFSTEVLKGSNSTFLSKLGISMRGSYIFSKRAILNIGFMLEKSQVALEVRNQALNIIKSQVKKSKLWSNTNDK